MSKRGIIDLTLSDSEEEKREERKEPPRSRRRIAPHPPVTNEDLVNEVSTYLGGSRSVIEMCRTLRYDDAMSAIRSGSIGCSDIEYTWRECSRAVIRNPFKEDGPDQVGTLTMLDALYKRQPPRDDDPPQVHELETYLFLHGKGYRVEPSVSWAMETGDFRTLIYVHELGESTSFLYVDKMAALAEVEMFPRSRVVRGDSRETGFELLVTCITDNLDGKDDKLAKTKQAIIYLLSTADADETNYLVSQLYVKMRNVIMTNLLLSELYGFVRSLDHDKHPFRNFLGLISPLTGSDAGKNITTNVTEL